MSWGLIGEGETAAGMSWKCGSALMGFLFLWFYFAAWISTDRELEMWECSQVWWGFFVSVFYFAAWISTTPKEKWVNPSHIFSRQYQDFLEDLEEDETIRKNVNIYRSEAFLTHSLRVIKSCLRQNNFTEILYLHSPNSSCLEKYWKVFHKCVSLDGFSFFAFNMKKNFAPAPKISAEWRIWYRIFLLLLFISMRGLLSF